MPLWNNNSGDWQNGANWIGGVPANGFGATADFVNQTNGGFMQVGIQQGAAVRLGTLNVTLTGTTDMVIRGSTNDAGTTPARLRFENVNGNVDPQAFVNINTAIGGGEFEISGLGGLEVELNYETIFNVINAGTTARLNAPIIGVTDLIKDGAGTLSIGSVNSSFSGSLIVTEGILQILNPSGFGSGNVLLRTGGTLKSSGTVNNNIILNSGAGGIQVANGSTLTLTDLLGNDSTGIMSFGDATDNGTIILNNDAIQQTSGTHNYRLAGGTVRLENALVAGSLFNNSGTGLLEISTGATLDTRGFDTRLSNLDMDGGSLRASTGALDVWITDRNPIMNVQTGTVYATAGIDELRIDALYGYSLAGLTFSGWTSGTDIITMIGNANGNTLGGSVHQDTIRGGGGDDVITGNGGADQLFGDAGDDVLIFNTTSTGGWAQGGTGTDTLRVTGGTVDLANVSGMESIELQNGATLRLDQSEFEYGFAVGTGISGNGNIILDLQGGGAFAANTMQVENGSTIALTINGTANIDIIKGLTDATNTINAGSGSDQVSGGALADVIYGGDGDDKVAGRNGADTIYGGSGADTFRYGTEQASGLGVNADRIMDFVSGTDKLSFLNLDTDPITPGHQGLSYVGTNAFVNNGTAQIRWTDLGADLRVEADVNGDGIADMHIMLMGAGSQTLTAGDFLL